MNIRNIEQTGKGPSKQDLYGYLRAEILQSAQSINTMMTVLLPAIAIIITAFANNFESHFFPLALHSIALFIAVRTYCLQRSINAIAAYMIVFLESDDQDVLYETHRFLTGGGKLKIRNKKQKTNTKILKRIIRRARELFLHNINAPTFWVGIVASIIYFRKHLDSINIYVAALNILSMITLLFYLWKTYRSPQGKASSIEMWKKCQDPEYVRSRTEALLVQHQPIIKEADDSPRDLNL